MYSHEAISALVCLSVLIIQAEHDFMKGPTVQRINLEGLRIRHIDAKEQVRGHELFPNPVPVLGCS